MRTVFASLPFYDSLAKQDVNRSNAVIPIHCPRTQLPPFLINLGSESIATITSVKLVDKNAAETDITTYFDNLPEIYDPTDTTFSPYIKYNGDTLNTLLPLGIFYVRITNGEIEYYSDYIRVDNIYENLITGWTNGDVGSTYETFTTSGTAISASINSVGVAHAESNLFKVRKGEVITIITTLELNSGQLPYFYLYGGAIASNIVSLADGTNVISLIATISGSVRLFIENYNITNFSTSEILTNRSYASDTIKLYFKNSANIGDLLYEDSFAQEVWLDCILNDPTHEFVTVGEEKDGIFIPEKITSKYLYTVICYVSRGLYQCLVRLPQHDTIIITDEVGNTYSPDAGNVFIDPPEWIGFETAKITIRFNDNQYSAFNWTKN